MWMCFTTLFALEPDRAIKMLERVVKILFVTFLALYTLYKREHVTWLVLIMRRFDRLLRRQGRRVHNRARRRRIWSGGHRKPSSPITTHLHSPSS